MRQSDEGVGGGGVGSTRDRVGDLLRERRVAHGVEIPQVASVLRIRGVYLDALERGDNASLPGVTYAIGFVRSYADYLGLDPEEMVRRFKAEASGLERPIALTFPSAAPSGRVPGLGPLAVALLTAALLAGAWYVYQGDAAKLFSRLPSVPERLAAKPATGTEPKIAEPPPPGAPVSQAPPPPPVIAATSAPVMPPVTSVAPPPVVASPTPPQPALVAAKPPVTPPVTPPPVVAQPATPPAPVAVTPPPAPPVPTAPQPPVVASAPSTPPAAVIPPAAPPPVAPTATSASSEEANVPGALPGGRVFGLQNTDSRVLVRARGESWVQVRDNENRGVFTQVLRNGDSYRVPNKPGWTMITGNAGVIDVMLDGAPLPSLGGVGIVRRNVVLDAEKLKALGPNEPIPSTN